MAKDLSGKRFGKLIALKIDHIDTKRHLAYWLCKCDCGNQTVVVGTALSAGNTKSCGCLHGVAHGMSKTRIYKVWASMLERCNNPRNRKFQDYGARNIKVCEEWHNFEEFFEDVSSLPHFGEKGYSLDRIDNDGNYEPGNVRWATPETQAHNKRNNRMVVLNGQSMTLAEASRLSGINRLTLLSRIKAGESGDELFRAPCELSPKRRGNCKYFVEYQGKTLTATEAARIAGISSRSMLDRIKKGYTGEELFKKSWYAKKYGDKNENGG